MGTSLEVPIFYYIGHSLFRLDIHLREASYGIKRIGKLGVISVNVGLRLEILGGV